MSVSKEVQAAVDKVREMKDYIKADKAADKIRDDQLAEAKSKQAAAESKLSELEAKIGSLTVDHELSQEDKDALQHAFDEASEAQVAAGQANDTAAEVHDELKDAVPANAAPPAAADPNSPGNPNVAAQPVADPQEPYKDLTADELADKRGEDKAAGPEAEVNNPEPVQAPLMPNMAFDPAGGVVSPPGDAGQPNQAPAIETAGGFLVAGGGATARAPGSRPESPSSSLIVPTDPNAKGPSSTADEVKSGLGDSSQNALLGNDGRPIADGPGMPKEPSEAQAKAEQERQDALKAEQAKREANPLNLSDEDLAKQNKGSGQAPASPAS